MSKRKQRLSFPGPPHSPNRPGPVLRALATCSHLTLTATLRRERYPCFKGEKNGNLDKIIDIPHKRSSNCPNDELRAELGSDLQCFWSPRWNHSGARKPRYTYISDTSPTLLSTAPVQRPSLTRSPAGVTRWAGRWEAGQVGRWMGGWEERQTDRLS